MTMNQEIALGFAIAAVLFTIILAFFVNKECKNNPRSAHDITLVGVLLSIVIYLILAVGAVVTMLVMDTGAIQ